MLQTGAGGGIGSAIAKVFAAAGATMAILDLREEELSATAAVCRAEVGGGPKRKLLAAVVDVSDDAAVAAFCNRARDELGADDRASLDRAVPFVKLLAPRAGAPHHASVVHPE